MKHTKVAANNARTSEARSFTWSVSTTEIAFMRGSDADAAREGSSSSNNDCSAIAKFDKPRKKRLTNPAGR